MADYAISNVPRRVVYAASGVGPYAFTFEILDQTDISVYKASTLLTLTTDYTVTINANGTGEVTLVSTAGTDNITIVGAKNIQRTSDFTTGGDLFANTLNDELDNQTIFIQQVAETAERGLKAPVTDPTDIAMTLPAKDGRRGKVLAFDSTTGNPVAGPALDAVVTVIEQSANINTVADNIGSVNTVAGNTSNINTVAGVSGNVTTVATNIANVNAVGADLLEPVSEINTVAVDIANVNTVGTNISNINTVAGVSAAVTTVAGISSAVSNVSSISSAVTGVNTISSAVTGVNGNATNINAVNSNSSNINTVAGIAANVTTVAGISSNVTTVATNNTNVNTVATNIATVNSVGGNIANVNAVAGNATNINAAVSNETNINSVAGNATNINAVASNSTNVNTVAGISANVTSVAGNATDISAVAAIDSDVSTVAGIAADIATVASDAVDIAAVAADIAKVIEVANDLQETTSEIDTVATNIANVNTVGNNIANVNTVAGANSNIATVANNISDVTTFADLYLGVSTTAPTATVVGALYYNSVDDQLYLWDGSVWQQAAFSATGTVTSFNGREGSVTLSGSDVTTALTYSPLSPANNLSDIVSTSSARANLGASTLGSNVFTITNPSAVTYPQFNADNTVSALNAADFRTAIGAGTGVGTVTSITGGAYLTGGTITTSGTLEVDATPNNTASKVVARDASGNFSAGTINSTLVNIDTPAYSSGTGINVTATGGGRFFGIFDAFNSEVLTNHKFSENTYTVEVNRLGGGSGVGNFDVTYNNTRVFRVTNDGLMQFNSGYGSAATAYGCRAWVNFNGQNTVTIRASGNVSSITDDGVGLYTLNFTTAMPNTNYNLVFGANNYNGTIPTGVSVRYGIGSVHTVTTPTLKSTSQVSIICGNPASSSGGADVPEINVAIFR